MSQQGFSGSSEAPGPETALGRRFSAVHRVPRLVSRQYINHLVLYHKPDEVYYCKSTDTLDLK